MKRRTLLASITTVAVAGCSDSDDHSDAQASSTGASGEPLEQTPEEIPDEVEDVEPLARSFTETIHTYYPDARVFVTSDGEIALEYISQEENPDVFETELHQIADQYAEVVENGGYDPVTLSIIAGEVQAVVPENTVDAYVRDDINEEAFHETIGITDVQRHDD